MSWANLRSPNSPCCFILHPFPIIFPHGLLSPLTTNLPSNRNRLTERFEHVALGALKSQPHRRRLWCGCWGETYNHILPSPSFPVVLIVQLRRSSRAECSFQKALSSCVDEDFPRLNKQGLSQRLISASVNE